MRKLIVAAIAAIGCGGAQHQAPSAPPETPPKPEAPAAGETKSEAPAKVEAPSSMREEPAKIEAAPPAPFAWPEIPSLDKVATEALHGVAAGRPLDIANVIIKHTSDGWQVRLVPGSRPQQYVQFDLNGTPKKGKKLTFKTEFGEHAALTVPKADEPSKLTGLAVPNSWAIEFTEFVAGTKTTAGHASGRLAIAFKASPTISGMAGYEASWFVGTFTEARVEP